MKTNCKPLETFHKYLEIVETNIIRASLYLKLHRKIEEYLNQQKADGKQEIGRIFLAEARTAFSQTGMLLLSKTYDKSKESISLGKILNCAEATNKHWPLVDIERKELQKNLKNDKEKIDEEKSDLVKKLITFRDKVIAHPGNDELKREKKIVEVLEKLDLSEDKEPLKTVLDSFLTVSKKPYSNFPHYLTWVEVDKLVDLAIEICSRYKHFAGSSDDIGISLEDVIQCEAQELFADLESLCDKE
ncbi:MAG TPA: hypothetical protein V6D16_07380 [Candidatus Obscuribacterales bacterium]